MTTRSGPDIKERRRERKALRPCLAPDHTHLILSTKDQRICDLGTKQIARLGATFSATVPVASRRYFPTGPVTEWRPTPLMPRR